MRIIIHDLENLDFINLKKDDYVVCNKNNKNCVGCFSCWIKTPFKCVHNDNIKMNGKKLFDSDELIIISKCINGCYSYKVKQILERSISFVEPYFTLRNKEIHHRLSNNKKINFKIYIYNEVTDEEKNTLISLANANMKNLNTLEPKIYFLDDIEDIKEII